MINASYTNETALIDGFTIRAGFASGTSTDRVAGGLLNAGGSPTVSNCILVANQATGGGGAVYTKEGGAGSFTDCVFENNRTIEGGAAQCGMTAASHLFWTPVSFSTTKHQATVER